MFPTNHRIVLQWQYNRENNEFVESILHQNIAEICMPHAIQIRQTGGPEVLNWTAVDVGEPGSGQVRLRQAAAGLNYIDVYHRTGYCLQPLPFIPGLEGAGTVEAVSPDARSEGRRSGGLCRSSSRPIVLRSRMLLTPTRHWKRAQPLAPPS